MRFIIFYLLVGAAASVQAAVVVYSDQSLSPALLNSEYKTVYLDKPALLQQQFFNSLPKDLNSAKQVVAEVIQSSDWKAKEQTLIAAYQDLFRAYQLNLQKYPAVVFDDRYVVYGTTDVVKAQQLLADHQGEK